MSTTIKLLRDIVAFLLSLFRSHQRLEAKVDQILTAITDAGPEDPFTQEQIDAAMAEVQALTARLRVSQQNLAAQINKEH